jgi:hypothetical protein
MRAWMAAIAGLVVLALAWALLVPTSSVPAPAAREERPALSPDKARRAPVMSNAGPMQIDRSKLQKVDHVQRPDGTPVKSATPPPKAEGAEAPPPSP